MRRFKLDIHAEHLVEKLTHEPDAQDGAEKGAGANETHGAVVLGTDAGLGRRHIFAERAGKVDLGALIDFLVELLR